MRWRQPGPMAGDSDPALASGQGLRLSDASSLRSPGNHPAPGPVPATDHSLYLSPLQLYPLTRSWSPPPCLQVPPPSNPAPTHSQGNLSETPHAPADHRPTACSEPTAAGEGSAPRSAKPSSWWSGFCLSLGLQLILFSLCSRPLHGLLFPPGTLPPPHGA